MRINKGGADSVKMVNSQDSQCVNRMQLRDDNVRNTMRVTRIRMCICMDMRRTERVRYRKEMER